MNTVGSLLRDIASWVPDIAVALVIGAITAMLGRMVMGWVTNRIGDSGWGRMLGRFAAVVLWGAGGATALGRVGVPSEVTVPILLTVLLIVGGVLAVLLIGGAGGSTPARRPRLYLVDSEPHAG
ncbi:hypothetical protein KO481_39255 [Nocardia sp. NEAU-G5]|uniref:Uncharacterized protein n=1 Tax=Nocardia albiluteola TaxID=2842303 RepID=A0ABS6BB82_9NOCA|nr:hypothetical protein [Nocardia albiluteola]MBU3067548.1 hypothetical protein [Nocardia albiluteola]